MQDKEYEDLLNLAYQLCEDEQFEQAIELYNKITREESPEWYAKAQFSLGLLYYKDLDDHELAAEAWYRVNEEDSVFAYERAQDALEIFLSHY